jgi:phage/plasmid-associated DNA primase
MVLFTMWNSFVGKEDADLGRALEAELPGIAQFALEGLRMLLVDDGKFTATASTTKTSDEFRTMQAPTATFLSECVEAGTSADWLPQRELYAAYKAWCAEHGHMPTSSARLSAELSYQFPTAASASATRRVGNGVQRGRERSHFRFTAEGKATLAHAAVAGFDDA